MAFGGLKGTLSVAANSITATTSATGSVAVAVGDLVFVVVAEQLAMTNTAMADNLGNVYTSLDFTNPASFGARAWSSYVSTAGTLTSVNATCTGSSNNVVIVVAVIEGPFNLPRDTSPAIISDLTSPFSCPATGTLASTQEVVVCFGVANYGTAWTATAPNLLALDLPSQAVIKAAVGYQAVTSTASVTPVFAAAANPTTCGLGTFSFRRGETRAVTVAGAGAATGRGAARTLRSVNATGSGAATGGGVARTLRSVNATGSGIASGAGTSSGGIAAPGAAAGAIGSFVIGGLPLGGAQVPPAAVGSVATAIGTGAATAASRTIRRQTGIAAGTGAAAATIRTVARSSGAASGTSAAIATSKAGSNAAAVGTGAATAIGRAINRRNVAAAGTGATAAIIRTAARAAGTAAGISSAIAPSKAGSNAAAAGTGTAIATGRALNRRIVSATGIGASTALIRTTTRTSGVAAGTGAALAQSKSGSRATSAGLGAGTAIGRATVRRLAVAAGLGAAAGISRQGSTRAASAGLGAASAVGQGILRRAATSAALGAATGIARGFARRTALAAGTGLAAATGKGGLGRAGHAAGFGAANAASHIIFRAVATAAGHSNATSIWRFAPYQPGICPEADHIVSRVDAAVAKYGQTITLQRLRTDPDTGENFISEHADCPAVVRNYIPQDLEAGEVQDIRVVLSPRWLADFGIPNRDDRIVVNDNPSNIEQIAPLYFCGQVVRVNLLCRG